MRKYAFPIKMQISADSELTAVYVLEDDNKVKSVVSLLGTGDADVEKFAKILFGANYEGLNGYIPSEEDKMSCYQSMVRFLKEYGALPEDVADELMAYCSSSFTGSDVDEDEETTAIENFINQFK